MCKRVAYIGFRVSEKDHATIKNKAQKAKLNISQYVSLSALDKDILVIEDVEKLVHELSKVGNNLNQLTMLSHQGRIKEVNLKETKEILNKIWDKLNDTL